MKKYTLIGWKMAIAFLLNYNIISNFIKGIKKTKIKKVYVFLITLFGFRSLRMSQIVSTCIDVLKSI